MKTRFGFSIPLVLIAAILLVVNVPPRAFADEYDEYDYYTKDSWPVSLTERPLALAPGMLELGGDTLYVNLSSGQAGDPVTLAPDIYYGVTRQLSLGIDHHSGICISSGCGSTYQDVALYALYSVMHGGSLDLAVLGGPGFPLLDPLAMGANVGLRAKLMVGSIAVVTGGELYVGIVGREEQNPRSEGWVHIPLQVQLQLQRQSAVMLNLGFDGPLNGYGSSLQVPVGLGFLFSLNNRIDVGGEFVFGDVSNSDARFDKRAIIVRMALRL